LCGERGAPLEGVMTGDRARKRRFEVPGLSVGNLVASRPDQIGDNTFTLGRGQRERQPTICTVLQRCHRDPS
jgi:hypothetical protein